MLSHIKFNRTPRGCLTAQNTSWVNLQWPAPSKPWGRGWEGVRERPWGPRPAQGACRPSRDPAAAGLQLAHRAGCGRCRKRSVRKAERGRGHGDKNRDSLGPRVSSPRRWRTPNTRAHPSTGIRAAPGRAHGPMTPSLGPGTRVGSVYPGLGARLRSP